MASPAPNTIPFPIPDPPPAAAAESPSAEAPSQIRLRPWQREVLQLLASGASVVQAVAHAGRSESAFFKACERHPEFAALAQEAREFHRASTSEAFHETEALARELVDRVLRDENLRASLRLRAALAILNRKGLHWLPSALPDFQLSPNLAEALHGAEPPSNPGDSPDALEELDRLDKLDKPNDPETPERHDTLDELDKLDNASPRNEPACRATRSPDPAPAPAPAFSI